MLQRGTRVKVSDKSGAKEAMCIGFFGKTGRYIKKALAKKIKIVVKKHVAKTMEKGSMFEAIVIRTKRNQRRKNGSYIRFDHNEVVLMKASKEAKEGGGIRGLVPREVVKNAQLREYISFKTSKIV